MSRAESIDDQVEKSTGYTERRPVFTDLFPEWRSKPDETNYVKILPPKNYKEDAQSPFGLAIHIHNEVGDNQDPFLCPKRMRNALVNALGRKPEELPEEIRSGKCPICEEQERLFSELGGEKKGSKFDEAVSYYPQTRIVFLIIDTCGPDEVEKWIQIYPAPFKKVYEEGMRPIFKIKRGEKAGENIDVSLPENMKDIAFDRKGKKLYDTVYSGFTLEESEMNVEDVLDAIKDLPDKWEDILNFASYAEIKEAFDGEEVPERVEKEEEPKKEAKEADRKGRRRTRTAEKEPEKESEQKEVKKEETETGEESKAKLKSNLRQRILDRRNKTDEE